MMKKNYVIIAASLLLIFLIYAAAELFIPLPFGNKPIEFEIKRGATFKLVVNSLSERRLVRDRWVIYTLGRRTLTSQIMEMGSERGEPSHGRMGG